MLCMFPLLRKVQLIIHSSPPGIDGELASERIMLYEHTARLVRRLLDSDGVPFESIRILDNIRGGVEVDFLSIFQEPHPRLVGIKKLLFY